MDQRVVDLRARENGGGGGSVDSVENIPTSEVTKTVASSTSADPSAFDFLNIVDAFDWVMSVRAADYVELQLDDGEHFLPEEGYSLANTAIWIVSISGNADDCLVVGNPATGEYKTALKFINSSFILENITFDFSRFENMSTGLGFGQSKVIFYSSIFLGSEKTYYAFMVHEDSKLYATGLQIRGGATPIRYGFLASHNSVSTFWGAVFKDIAQMMFFGSTNAQVILRDPTFTNVPLLGAKMNEVGTNGSFLKIGEEGQMTQEGSSGDTASRPPDTTNIGTAYFDTDLNSPTWWNGSEWSTRIRTPTSTEVECEATYIPDLKTSKVFTLVLTENLIVADFINAQDGDKGSFRIIQDAVGGHSIVGSSGYRLIGFTASEITLPANQYAFITFEVVYGTAVLQLICKGDIADIDKFNMAIETAGSITVDSVVGGSIAVSPTANGYLLSSKDEIESFNIAGDIDQVTEVLINKSKDLTTLANRFNGFSAMEAVTLSNLRTANVANMASMLRGCSSLTTPPDFSNFDTSNVANMAYMLFGCSSLTTPPDFSNFDTSNVANMAYMLYGCSSLTTPPDFSNFDTANVTSLAYILYGCSSLTTPPDFSGFDTANVANLYAILYGCSSLTTPPDFSNFDTANVTSLAYILYGCSSLTTPPDFSNFDTSNVASMTSMLRDCSSLTTPPDFSNFDTANVTSLYAMLFGCSSLTTPPDFSGFDTANVANLAYMLRGCSSLTTPPDFSNFDTSNVANMAYMLFGCSSLTEIGNIGIENFNIFSLTDATNFAKNATFATATMDLILVNWEAQPHNPNVTVDFGNGNYTLGGAAETAYNALVADGWIITGITGA